jgi:hypothetical protein
MKKIKKSLTALAVIGNILFMLWVSYNAVVERFEGSLWQKLSYIGLMGLLTVNTMLILYGKRQ